MFVLELYFKHNVLSNITCTCSQENAKTVIEVNFFRHSTLNCLYSAKVNVTVHTMHLPRSGGQQLQLSLS